MKHAILTRIDVPLTIDVYNDDWSLRRQKLFEAFCLPSVENQVYKKFTWIVFVRTGSPMLRHAPQWFAMFKGTNTVLRIEEVDDNYAVKRIALEWAQQMLKEQARDDERGQGVMTTRLDADDCLATDFTEQLHEVSIPGMFIGDDRWHKSVINFDNGLVLDLKNDTVLKDVQRSNPFMTMVEFDDDPVTVWGAPHHELNNVARMLNVETPNPMWVQVIHGGNLFNQKRGKPTKLGPDKWRFPKAVRPTREI